MIEAMMRAPLFVSFVGGDAGAWRVDEVRAVIGETLPGVSYVQVVESAEARNHAVQTSGWVLRGVTSNTRYTTSREAEALKSRQEGLGRVEATRAVLIPIRKSAAWWAMAQDERRAVLEEQSRHIAIGMEYLPGIARRLHHGRDLGEPFDFLTWFEFAPEHAVAFGELLKRLRATPEWSYIEREIEVQLTFVR